MTRFTSNNAAVHAAVPLIATCASAPKSESSLTKRQMASPRANSNSPQFGNSVTNLARQSAKGFAGVTSSAKSSASDAANASGPVAFTKAMVGAPLEVSKSVAKGVVDIGYSAAVHGVKTVGSGVHAVSDVVAATPGVARVAAAANAPRAAVWKLELIDAEQLRTSDAEIMKSNALSAATLEEEGSSSTRNWLLASVCFLEMMANFDAGLCLPCRQGQDRGH